MSVVERGLARCPRCVAVADYAFVESGPNSLRYEVNCRRCGEAYCEVHNPVTPDFTAAAGALVVRPRDPEAPATEAFRQRALVRVADARESVSGVAGRALGWIAVRASTFRH